VCSGGFLPAYSRQQVIMLQELLHMHGLAERYSRFSAVRDFVF